MTGLVYWSAKHFRPVYTSTATKYTCRKVLCTVHFPALQTHARLSLDLPFLCFIFSFSFT